MTSFRDQTRNNTEPDYREIAIAVTDKIREQLMIYAGGKIDPNVFHISEGNFIPYDRHSGERDNARPQITIFINRSIADPKTLEQAKEALQILIGKAKQTAKNNLDFETNKENQFSASNLEALISGINKGILSRSVKKLDAEELLGNSVAQAR